MSGRRTLATTARVLAQLRRDPRTIALLLVVPTGLMVLIRYVFDSRPGLFDQIGGPLIGLFPFITMFLVTSITMLRERTGGTLERLMAMPLGRLDLLAGYGLAFAGVAAVQAAVVTAVALGLLGLEVAAPAWAIGGVAIADAVLGTALGLLLSAFATTEFQAVQFMPAVVFPQLFLCGLFIPREDMAGVLEAASYVMPLTYAYDALARLTEDGALGARGWADLAVVVGCAVAALALGAATLRRS